MLTFDEQLPHSYPKEGNCCKESTWWNEYK